MIEKPFITVKEQIDLLSKRNLLFLDKEYAREALLKYGYYEIINGYKDFLIDHKQTIEKGSDYFLEGSEFEHVYALFILDKKIRNAVLAATLEIECSLRTAISYVIGKHYGHNQAEYLKRTNYRSGKKNFNENGKNMGYKIDQIIHKFNKITADNVQPMKHYREKHGNVPPWIMLKGATFGNLLHFLKLIKPEQKNEILSIVSGFPQEVFATEDSFKTLYIDLLFLCHSYRNRSAHTGRMYNYRASKSEIKFNDFFHKRINITNDEYKKRKKGSSDLFTFYKSLDLFENKQASFELDFNLNWHVSEHFKKYHNDEELLLKEMGFPKNYKFRDYNNV